jgi:hypothetical protein
MTMDRLNIVMGLEAIVVARLFGVGPWLVDRQTADTLSKRLVQLGVLPGQSDPWPLRSFGKPTDLFLHLVFMGMWSEFEEPSILEDRGLFPKSEIEPVYDQLEAGLDPELVLKDHVQRAYFDYYGQAKFRS